MPPWIFSASVHFPDSFRVQVPSKGPTITSKQHEIKQHEIKAFKLVLVLAESCCNPMWPTVRPCTCKKCILHVIIEWDNYRGLICVRRGFCPRRLLRCQGKFHRSEKSYIFTWIHGQKQTNGGLKILRNCHILWGIFWFFFIWSSKKFQFFTLSKAPQRKFLDSATAF